MFASLPGDDLPGVDSLFRSKPYMKLQGHGIHRHRLQFSYYDIIMPKMKDLMPGGLNARVYQALGKTWAAFTYELVLQDIVVLWYFQEQQVTFMFL